MRVASPARIYAQPDDVVPDKPTRRCAFTGGHAEKSFLLPPSQFNHSGDLAERLSIPLTEANRSSFFKFYTGDEHKRVSPALLPEGESLSLQPEKEAEDRFMTASEAGRISAVTKRRARAVSVQIFQQPV